MGAKSILCTLCMEKIISLHRYCYIALLFAQRYYSVCRQYRFQSRAKYHSHHCIYFICCTSREKRISANAGSGAICREIYKVGKVCKDFMGRAKMQVASVVVSDSS